MYETIVQLISNVGFPIVAFLLMYRLVTDTIQKNTEAITQTNNAIIKLNETVEKLCEKVQ